MDFLVEIVEAVPDITLGELAAPLESEHGVQAHPASISRVLTRAGLTYKKVARRLGARAGGRPRGARGLDRPAPAADAAGAAPVSLSTNAAPKPTGPARAAAPGVARVRDHAPFRHAGTQTFIAGLRYDRLVASWVLDGPINRAAFDAWVETQLAPVLQKGDVVILDNLAVHKSPGAEAILREKGAWFRFLRPTPPTSTRSRWPSPSSRPTCRIGARTLDALWRAIGEICDLFTPEECWNYLREAGCEPE